MTTYSFDNAATPLRPVALAGNAAPTAEPPLDAGAVEQARREIQTLLREVAQLAKSDVPPAEFYQQMLSRAVSALAAIGGAVWTRSEQGDLELAYQINLEQAGLRTAARQQQHAALLKSALDSREGLLVPPRSGSETTHNPTELLLVLAPIPGESGPQGVVEILQRPNTRSGTQRGFLRFVQQMGELAADYDRTRRLKHFADKQTLWQQLDRFTRTIHKSLCKTTVAYAIANEGRRLIGCDRLSVALYRGRTCRIEAISGQDCFDPRASVTTRLAKLATAVLRTGEPLWYTGSTEALAPQLERAVEAYVDLAHSKAVAIVPLVRPLNEAKGQSKGELLGALIVEQIEDCRLPDGRVQAVQVVAEHSAAALANAVEHESLFLLPLWRALGKIKLVVSARMLPKTAAALFVLVGIVAALALVPADFQLEAKGVLQPTQRRDVFAGIDGVVIDVPVAHADQVAEKQLLASLRNTDLEVQITDLVGRREATAKQLQSLQRALLSQERMSVEEKNRLAGQVLQLRGTHDSLGLQLELLRKKQAQLQITSPIAGQIVTWQVAERLLRRPVRQGQILMSVANPHGPWHVELHMPEDRMGHIAQAARESNEPLQVEYILATQPGETHRGQVREIEAAAEVRGEEGNTVLIHVEIDQSKLRDLRPGATVTGKVHCGTRSLGYVWLHDLWAFVQRKILFRL